MTPSLGVTRTSEVSPTVGVPGVAYSEHSAHRLLQLFDLSVDAMAVVGIDGYFKTLNPAWSMLLGFSAEELLSCPYIEFVHPDDRRDTVDATAGLADGSELIKFECRYLCQDGTPLPEAGPPLLSARIRRCWSDRRGRVRHFGRRSH
jgi:PAS domain S-box-containing protein